MKIHTVFISYNRLELTKEALFSYFDTVTVPHTAIVVDNGSDEATQEWLLQHYDRSYPSSPDGFGLVLLGQNLYPGAACNNGWAMAPDDADFLHRADNDFMFLPGWCEEVKRAFRNRELGQLGMRTNQEECHAPINVGGNCVIRRELWNNGLRYDERPWPQIRAEVGVGQSEDSFFSPAVKAMGYTWTRVKRPCIAPLEGHDMNDPYYMRSFGDRGIEWT